jgi:F-box and WD-40 domain protein CDC4
VPHPVTRSGNRPRTAETYTTYETPRGGRNRRRLRRDDDSLDDADTPVCMEEAVDLKSKTAYRPKSNMSRRPKTSALQRTRSSQYSGPATPDATLLDTASLSDTADSFDSSTVSDATISSVGTERQVSFPNAPSPPTETASEVDLSGSVATPPVIESDPEPFEAISTAFTGSVPPVRPLLNTAENSNASLPSPSLSPTLAAANLHTGQFQDDEDADTVMSATNLDSQNSLLFDADTAMVLPTVLQTQDANPPTVLEVQTMLNTFDAMPAEMKSFMMYQFLRRCPRPTLHMVANTVNPALQCDFLDQLPLELSLNILSFLELKDLCQAAQVSKRWRSIVDSNETGWKELLERDNYVLPPGELERAINEGWGWQDPEGFGGWERNISGIPSDLNTRRLGSFGPGHELITRSKRKRQGSQHGERAKRRVVSEGGLRPSDATSQSIVLHKSEGPNSAANAAALACPNPKIGLESLRNLHLYKSLYRRRYMLEQSWTSGKVKPYHMAFQAHPNHVITCLQFDDDKIVTGSDDTFIHVYDTKTGALRRRLSGHEGGVWALAYDGNVLVSGSTDRSVRVWDIEKGLCTQVFYGHTSTVRCLTILKPTLAGYAADGKPIMLPEKPLIITGSRDSHLRVWKLPEPGDRRHMQTGPPVNDSDCPYFVRVLQGHQHSVRAIAAHQDTLVSGSYDMSVRVWKISTGESVWRLEGHTQKVYSVVLDHKRNRCISGSMDNFVKIWSLNTGTCLYTLEGHTSLVGLLDLRAERLVSAAADYTLRIWDVETGCCKHTLTAHTGAITCFQHDGRKVISGSDRTLKMWDVNTGECIQDLLTDLSGVWQVKFDERRCVAAVQRDNVTYIEVGPHATMENQAMLTNTRFLILELQEMACKPKN